MQLIRTVIIASWLLAGPVPPALAAPAPAADLFEDTVLARGKGFEVKSSQLENAFIAYKSNLAARGQNLPESQRNLREAQLLDRLVVTRIMVNRATDADRAQAKKVAEKFLQESQKTAGSDEAFNRQLKAMGLTRELFDSRVQEQALAEAVLDRELKSTITVSDAQIRDFYETGTDELVRIMQGEFERLGKDPAASTNQLTAVKDQITQLRNASLAKLQQPEKVRVSHIYFATRNRQTEDELSEDQKRAKRQALERLLVRARAGEDFAKMVLTYSEDQGLKETKGEYTFSRQDNFTPEFKAAAFSLAAGQISEIVTTTFGYHIIKLLERIPAQKIPLDKVKDGIKDHLTQQALQQKMPAYFARLKKEASVEILEPKYRLSNPESADADPGTRP